MRKNIYDDKILMINRSELERLLDSARIYLTNRELFERLQTYKHLCDDYGANLDEKIGISIADEVDEQIMDAYEKVTENDKISVTLSDVKNAYIYSVVNEKELKDTFDPIVVDVINSPSMSNKEFINKYGRESLEYIEIDLEKTSKNCIK